MSVSVNTVRWTWEGTAAPLEDVRMNVASWGGAIVQPVTIRLSAIPTRLTSVDVLGPAVVPVAMVEYSDGSRTLRELWEVAGTVRNVLACNVRVTVLNRLAMADIAGGLWAYLSSGAGVSRRTWDISCAVHVGKHDPVPRAVLNYMLPACAVPTVVAGMVPASLTHVSLRGRPGLLPHTDPAYYVALLADASTVAPLDLRVPAMIEQPEVESLIETGEAREVTGSVMAIESGIVPCDQATGFLSLNLETR